jgi:hypothetical protein
MTSIRMNQQIHPQTTLLHITVMLVVFKVSICFDRNYILSLGKKKKGQKQKQIGYSQNYTMAVMPDKNINMII